MGSFPDTDIDPNSLGTGKEKFLQYSRTSLVVNHSYHSRDLNE